MTYTLSLRISPPRRVHEAAQIELVRDFLQVNFYPLNCQAIIHYVLDRPIVRRADLEIIQK